MELHGGSSSKSYEVILRKQPEKYLRKLDTKSKHIFEQAFQELESQPFEIAHPLHGGLGGLYKVRLGNRRMILMIDKRRKRIEILEIGPRGDIYK